MKQLLSVCLIVIVILQLWMLWKMSDMSYDIHILHSNNESLHRKYTYLRFRYDRIKDWAEEYRQQEFANYISMEEN